jgi:hypothetical protein
MRSRSELFEHIFTDYVHWRRNYFPADPWIVGRVRRRSDEHESWYDWLTSHLDVILAELKYHFPFHSPRYNAHMLSELSLPAVLGYFGGGFHNPNNVTAEAPPHHGGARAKSAGWSRRCWLQPRRPISLGERRP